MEKALKNNKLLQTQAIIHKRRSVENESCDVNFFLVFTCKLYYKHINDL